MGKKRGSVINEVYYHDTMIKEYNDKANKAMETYYNIFESTDNTSSEEYIVKPHIGFNSIKFGQQRSKIQRQFVPNDSYKKTNKSSTLTDEYDDFHLFYDNDDTLEAVEFYDGRILLEHDTLYPSSINTFLSTLKKHGGKYSIDDNSLTCSNLGIRASLSQDENKVTSILIHNKNY